MPKFIRFFICLFIFISINFRSKAQEYKYEIGGEILADHYMGDLSREFIFSSWSFGGGINFRYNFNFRTAIHSSLTYQNIKINSDFADNILPDNRVFDFRKNLINLNLSGEYNFFAYSDKYKYLNTYSYTPYISLGIGSIFANKYKFQVLPYLSFAFGLKWKIINRLNMITSYSYQYGIFDSLELVDVETEKLDNPFRVNQSFLKSGDALGVFSISFTWDIGLRRESNCN